MGLVSSTLLLQQARQEGYAVVAFNVHTLEMLQAVVEAAEEEKAPVILQTTVGTVKHLGMDYLVAAAQVAAGMATVPIALHLDHCTDEELIMKCIQAGYTSVMIDASMFSFEENVERTRRVVQAAKRRNVNVEAELGKVGGVEDDRIVDEAEALLADPNQCEQFVRMTQVPTLAPAIGTAHGMYKGEPKIDFERIQQIADSVAVPLVLHGGSGIPDEQVKRCISLGMAKMNVATQLKNAFTDTLRHFFNEHPKEADPRAYMAAARDVVKQMAKDKISLCGSSGKG